MKRKRLLLSLLSVITFSLGQLQVAPAGAQVSGIDIDFAAAEPLTYNHATGGGKWNNGNINVDIERSLEGEDFSCGDTVSYLTRVSAGTTSSLRDLGAMTLDLKYSFTMDTTGQSGVALSAPFFTVLTSGDSAANYDEGSSVSVTDSTSTGPIYQKGSLLLATVRLTDLEAGETIIVRTDVRVLCQVGTRATGNLQAKFEGGFLAASNGGTQVTPPVALGSGARTVDLKNVSQLLQPELALAKTVTTSGGTCPGAESITVEPEDTVRYCYLVSNPSNSGGRPGAPVYNLTSITDDGGQFPDFTVALMTGLTDVDGDGQVDDLAAGATATAYYELAFDGDKDSTITNTAAISGYTASVGGSILTATDSATVFVDAPEILPSISVDKVTNGSDGSTILVGATVTWTYTVTNSGNVPLVSVALTDSDLGAITCPSTELAVAAVMTCTITGVATRGDYSNTATVSGIFATTTVSDTDDSSYFGADPKLEVTKSPDSQVVEEGKTASFTITVTNSGNVPLTNVAVVDSLAPNCDRTIGAMAIGAVVTYTCVSPVVTTSYNNVAVASGTWNDTPVSDSDGGGVTIDYLPKISVLKTANVASIPETGGLVTFTVSVKNEAPEGFTLNSLTDDKFGNLNGQGSCVTPQVIIAGATYSCTFAKTLASDSLITHTNVVTASGVDPEQHPASASDEASVSFTDVLPDIALSKVANPTAAKWTGDFVDYTFTVTNLGLETVTITAFSDDRFALSPECLALIGQTLAPSGARQCLILDAPVSGSPGGMLTNTATVIARDNEMNTDTATASATIKFWWYGRSPGYWKNNAEAWISGFTPNQFIQDVFIVPADLLSGGNLDIDRVAGKDTLMAGLSYQGGSSLRGAAQILFRAAIAALLNEAYYGADFPPAATTGELITMVNNALATGKRAQYLTLASYFDYWNNAVHASLP